MSVIESTVGRVRRPEYTGENRCMPCTAVNSVIAVVLAVALGLIWLPLGVAGIIIFAGAIYVRGYLIPGTPELTKRYFPAWALAWFGKEPVSLDDTPDVIEDEVTVETVLVDHDVVEPCDDVDDLCLDDDFRTSWWERIELYRDDEPAAIDKLSEVLDLDPDEVIFEEQEPSFKVTYEGSNLGRWISASAFYADLGAEPTLREWIPEWDDLNERVRTETLAGLRVFLEACPICGGALTQEDEVRETCCSSKVVGIALQCADCEAKLFRSNVS